MASQINFENVRKIEWILQSAIVDEPNLVSGQEVVSKDPTSKMSVAAIPSRVDASDVSVVESFSLDTIFQRDYLYPETFIWQTSTPRFNILAQFNLPDAFLSMQSIAPYGVASYHALYKSDFRITIRTDATNYNQGIMLTVVFPGESTPYEKFENLNYATLRNLPHVFMNVSNETEVALDVPYGSLFPVVPISARDTQFSARVISLIWSPLVSSTAAPFPISLSYWLRPVNPYVAVKSVFMAPQGLMDSVIKPAAHMILDNFDLPYGDKIKGVAKVFGAYDRTIIEDKHPESGRCADAPVNVVNTKINALEFIPDVSSRFDISMKRDLVDFAKVPSLAAILQWATSAPSGFILAEYVISPSSPMLEDGVGTSTLQPYLTTNTAGVASLFKYYRGSMEIEVMVAASQFHRGTLFLAFDPYGITGKDSSAVFGLPGVSMALGSVSNVLRLKLPYSKSKDYLETQFPEPDIDNQLGRLYVVVQNVLTAPVSVAPNVELLFSVSVSDDAEFRYPLPLSQRKVKHQVNMVYQGDTVLDLYNSKPLKPGFIVGNHTDLLDLMRRPEYISRSDLVINVSYYITFRGLRFPEKGIHAILLQLHKYNSGGIIVHYHTNVNRTMGVNAYFNWIDKSDVYSAYGSYVVRTSVNSDLDSVWEGAIHNITRDPVVNFLMPGYHDIPLFYNVSLTESDGVRRQGSWALSVDVTEAAAGSYLLSNILGHSVADDFMMYFPMPMFKIATAKSVTDGLLPVLVPPTGGGYTVDGANITNFPNLFDQNFVTYCNPTAAGTASNFRVTMQPGNTNVVSQIFLNLEVTNQDLILTITSSLNGDVTTLSTGPMYTYNGKTILPSTQYCDWINVVISAPLSTADWKIYVVQYYAAPMLPLLPNMSGNLIPAGWRTTGTGDPDNAWKVRDGSITSQWLGNSTAAEWTIESLTDEFTFDRFTVRAPNVSTGWLEWKLYRTNSLTQLLYESNSQPLTNGVSYSIDLRNTPSLSRLMFKGVTATANPLGLVDFQLYYNPSTSSVPSNMIPQGDSEGSFTSIIADFSRLSTAFTALRDTAKANCEPKGLFAKVFGGAADMNQMLTVASKMNAVFQSLVLLLNSLLKLIVQLSGLVSSIYMLISTTSSVLAATAIVSLIEGIRKLTSSVERNDELCPQSGFGDKTEALLDLIRSKSEIVADACRTLFDPFVIVGIVQRIFSKFGYNCDSIVDIYRRLSHEHPDWNPLYAGLMSAVEYLVHGETFAKERDAEFKRDVTVLSSELQKILTSYKFGDGFSYKGTFADGDTHLKTISSDVEDLRLRSAMVKSRTEIGIRDVECKLTELRNVMGKEATMKHHIEPVSAFFFGGPGVGKTLLTAVYIPMLLNYRLRNNAKYKKHYVDFSKKPYDEHSDLLTHVLITSEHLKYDSLYHHQPFIVFDDVFTERTSMDSAMLTRLINGAPLEVAKADVNSKGDVYDSPFVLLTSNESDPVARARENVNSGEKVLRRIGKMFEITKRTQTPFNIDCLKFDSSISIEELHRRTIVFINTHYMFKEWDYSRNTWQADKVDNPRAGLERQFEYVLDYLQNSFDQKSGYISPINNLIAGMCAQGELDSCDMEAALEHYSQYLEKQFPHTSDNLLEVYTQAKKEVEMKYAEVLTDNIRKEDSELETADSDVFYTDESEEDDSIEGAISNLQFSPWDEMFPYRHSADIQVIQGALNSGKREVVMTKMRTNHGIAREIKNFFDIRVMSNLPSWNGLLRYITRCDAQFPFIKWGLAAGVSGALILALTRSAYKMLKQWCSAGAMALQNLVYENKSTIQKVAHLKTPGFVLQDEAHLNQCDINNIALIRKNVAKIMWKSAGGVVVSRMHCLFLNSSTVVVNRHFFDDEIVRRNAGYSIYIQQRGVLGGALKDEVVSIPIDQRCDVDKTADMIVCKLAITFPNISNIYKHIATKNVGGVRAVLIGFTPTDDSVVNWNGNRLPTPVCGHDCILEQIDFVHVKTVKGDCGRPYYMPGVGLMGIHSAISSCGSFAGATRVPKITLSDTPYRQYKVEGITTSSKFWSSQTPLMVEAQVDGVRYDSHVVRKTTLVPIEPKLVSDEECDYVPAQQRVTTIVSGDDTELVDPLLKNSQKWETNKIAAVPLRYVVQMARHLSNKVPSVNPRVLTEHEAINGFGKMVPIRMTTSPGLWSRYGFKDGKKQIFTPLPQENGKKLEFAFSDKAKNDVLDGFGKSLYDIILEKEESMKEGEVPAFVFLCSMKDELRPKAKVEIAKTRVFEQSSLDFVYLCRKYFGHFIDAYKNGAGFELYHGIGRDVDAVWKQYAEGLLQNSNVGHAFDYKNFDGSIPAECFTFFRLVTDEYYCSDAESMRVRHCIIEAMQNALHSMGTYVFESTQGNKSGNAFTDVFNSISNTFLVWTTFLSWQVHTDQNPNLSAFDKSVRMLTYGDDIVMTVKKNLLERGWDAIFIQNCLKELGVTITSASKGEGMEPHVPFEQLTFLKRPFVYDSEQEVWLAPLPVKDILKELKYRHVKCENMVGDLEDRCFNVQRFLIHHAKSTFKEWVSKLVERTGRCDWFSVSYDAERMSLRVKQEVECLLYCLPRKVDIV